MKISAKQLLDLHQLIGRPDLPSLAYLANEEKGYPA